jgi:hypothetical protein
MIRTHWDTAEPLLRESLRVRRATRGDLHPDAVGDLMKLGVLWLFDGDPDAGRRALTQCIAQYSQLKKGAGVPYIAPEVAELLGAPIAEELLRKSITATASAPSTPATASAPSSDEVQGAVDSPEYCQWREQLARLPGAGDYVAAVQNLLAKGLPPHYQDIIREFYETHERGAGKAYLFEHASPRQREDYERIHQLALEQAGPEWADYILDYQGTLRQEGDGRSAARQAWQCTAGSTTGLRRGSAGLAQPDFRCLAGKPIRALRADRGYCGRGCGDQPADGARRSGFAAARPAA